MYHTTTKMSQFEYLYGYPDPSITSFMLDHSKVEELDSHMEKTKQTLKIIKENLLMA